MKSITYSSHDQIRVNPFVSNTTQNRPQKTATIQDVARAARVSTATVSRALSNPDLLSDSTRAAVMDAIRTTGYRVNQAARNLRMQRAGAVLILVPNLGKPFYSRILAGISDGFADSDYAVLIADTESRPLREGELEGYFLDGRIDGVISLDGGLDPGALQACVDAGGSISGEHGIGSEKLEFMPMLFSEADLDLQAAVRDAIDPEGLANPGKLVPDRRVSRRRVAS